MTTLNQRQIGAGASSVLHVTRDLDSGDQRETTLLQLLVLQSVSKLFRSTLMGGDIASGSLREFDMLATGSSVSRSRAIRGYGQKYRQCLHQRHCDSYTRMDTSRVLEGCCFVRWSTCPRRQAGAMATRHARTHTHTQAPIDTRTSV